MFQRLLKSKTGREIVFLGLAEMTKPSQIVWVRDQTDPIDYIFYSTQISTLKACLLKLKGTLQILLDLPNPSQLAPIATTVEQIVYDTQQTQ